MRSAPHTHLLFFVGVFLPFRERFPGIEVVTHLTNSLLSSLTHSYLKISTFKPGCRLFQALPFHTSFPAESRSFSDSFRFFQGSRSLPTVPDCIEEGRVQSPSPEFLSVRVFTYPPHKMTTHDISQHVFRQVAWEERGEQSRNHFLPEYSLVAIATTSFSYLRSFLRLS